MTKQERELQAKKNCTNTPQCKNCLLYSIKYRSENFWHCGKHCIDYDPTKEKPMTEAQKRRIAKDEQYVKEEYQKVNKPMIDYSIFTGGK